MRQLFKILSFIFLLTSCGLKTKSSRVDFLFSNYTLFHAFEYSPENMERHSFIDPTQYRLLDSYFGKETFLQFFFNKDTGNPYLDYSYQEKGVLAQKEKNVSYEMELENLYFGTIKINSPYSLFALNDITVYPNYWLRIHFQRDIDGEMTDIILEYKRQSINPV